jgi:hypothetical protein
MQNDSVSGKLYLRRGVCKSITTVAIGSIAILEEAFGHLWGHGKDYEELDEDEREWFETWKEVRSAILDRAGTSRQILLENLDKFIIKEKQFFTRFNKG